VAIVPDHLIGDGDRAYIGADPRRDAVKVCKLQRLPLTERGAKRCAEAGIALVIRLDRVPNIATTSCVESGVECQPGSVGQPVHDMSLNRTERVLPAEGMSIEVRILRVKSHTKSSFKVPFPEKTRDAYFGFKGPAVRSKVYQ
jgi:hypothetical protein